MSAATLWGRPGVSVAGSSVERPRLVLVPGGAAVGRRAPGARLRITRRGRLSLTAAAVVLLVLAGAFVARVGTADAAPGRTVVVPAGSTLSEIAHRELPDRPLEQAIADIERANGLVADQVSAGQVLSIPAV